MNRTEHDSHDPVDPERLLARGLRDTTPEFEARFDALCRRLANEPARRSLLDHLVAIVRGHPLWVAGMAAAALALAVSVVRDTSRSGAIDDARWYAEAVALDDALRGALVLGDVESREAVTLMPVEFPGGGS